jgi:gamma-glutamyltranspeptidase/glutathione hydrolase
VIAGVAAGHPATAAAGVEVLADGGTAADAAVAACLASAGAYGGTRLRTALVTVAAGVLDERVEPQEAVAEPRAHPAGDVVHAEPGVDEDGLAELERAGRSVRRWPARHHYFGGVSAIGRTGLAADPRRSGAALRVPGAG